uniref:NlpC/P60 domain-containing protein n=1 Tax=Athene cunicularia TaxID=194338 RepID=A0A663M8E9_ATHCN
MSTALTPHFCSSLLAGIKQLCKEMETLEFLLFNTADRFGEVFMKVSDRELQPGDIVLFPMDSRSGASSSFKHAAVYCKDGEVIHFQSKHPNPCSPLGHDSG